MNLRRNQITIGELMKHPGAREIAQREFPKLAGNPIAMRMAANMTLEQVMALAKDLPRHKAQGILEELRRL